MTLVLRAALPDDRDALLLQAALRPSDEAAAAWRSWRAQVTVEDSPPRVHGLFPLVAAHLSEDEVGTDAAKLQGLRRRAWAVTERLRTRLPGIVEQLAGVGAQPRPIRGAAFLADPEPTGRPVDRLDLQVRPDRWTAAVQALLATGWHVAVARSRSDAGIVLEDSDGIRVVLDWAPGFPGGLRRPLASALDDTSGDPSGDPTRLLVAVVEGLRPPGYPPLTWPVDVSLLARRMGARDWDGLVTAAADAQVSPVVGAGLDWAHRAVGADVPAAVVEALAGGPIDATLRRRFGGYAEGDPQPDRTGRRLDMLRAARRHGIDIGLGAPDGGMVTRVRTLLRSPSSPGGPGRS